MPGNPFAQEQERRTGGNPFAAELERRPSAVDVARGTAGRRFVDSLLAVPSTSGNLMADAMAGARATVKTAAGFGMNNARSLVGMDRIERPTFGERLSSERESPPLGDRAMRAVPRPTAEGLTAAIESVPSLLPGGETPSEAMGRNRAEYQRDEFYLREAHPTAAKVGDVGGDVLALLLGRRSTGMNKIVQRVESRLGGRIGVDVAESLADDLKKTFAGPAMQKLARGGVRSLEAGVEAAAMDILKDPNADPIETAALAAGGQLVGSGTLQTAKGLLSGGPTSAGLKLTVAAVGAMGLIQTFKSAVPGGRDRILESAESGFDKVMLTLGLGIGAAALGATRYGRGNTALADQTRAMLDGLATVHRGSTLSILSDWTEGDADKKASIESVLTALSKDPTYRGNNEAERDLVQKIRASNGLVRYKSGEGF